MKKKTLREAIRFARLRAIKTNKPMTRVKRHRGRKITSPGLVFDFERIDEMCEKTKIDARD